MKRLPAGSSDPGRALGAVTDRVLVGPAVVVGAARGPWRLLPASSALSGRVGRAPVIVVGAAVWSLRRRHGRAADDGRGGSPETQAEGAQQRAAADAAFGGNIGIGERERLSGKVFIHTYFSIAPPVAAKTATLSNAQVFPV